MWNRKLIALRSVAVILVLVLGLSGITCGATEANSTYDSSDSKTLRLLDALGIMGSDEYTGKFWDESPVKRSEMARIICRIFKLEEKEDDTPLFTDVRDSERGCVETAVRSGYMKGYGDGRFGADDFVTNGQLIKIFVCMLGAQQLAENMGGYPDGYMTVGRRTGISSGIGSADAVARRIDVAKIIYNTMHADMFRLSGIEGSETVLDTREGETFLSEVLDIYTTGGILEENSFTALNRVGNMGGDSIRINDELYSDPRHLTDDYLGCNVTVYYRKPGEQTGEVIYIEDKNDNKTVEVEDSDIVNISGQTVTYYDAKNADKKRTLTVSNVADMIYNGGAVEYDSERLKINNGKAKFVDNDGDGKYDVVLITEYKTYIASRVRIEDESINLKYDEPSLRLSDSVYRIYRNGKEISFEDIKEDDVLSVAESAYSGSARAVRIEASSNTVMGVADRMRTDDAEGKSYAYIGDAEYEISDYCVRLISRGKIDELTAGASGLFYVDSRGKIVAYEINSSGSGVGYLVESAFDTAAFTPIISVRMFTTDNKMEVFTARDSLKINGEKTETADAVKNAALTEKFNTAQLVKYSADNGVLKEIIFAADSYDPIEFSKDASGTFNCSCATVLDDKYCVSASTKVFVVPKPAVNEKAYYNIYTGSYFVRDVSYNGSLYDVGPDNMVGFAVIERGLDESNLQYDSPLLLVESVADGIDADGMVSKMIEGYDERGNKVNIPIDDELASGINSGDVLHYRTDFSGRICEKNRIKTNSKKYSLDVLKSTTKTVYGEVGAVTSDRLMVSCTPVTADMTPLDMAKSVTNNGKAVYKYLSDRQTVIKIDFSEIERGDKVFACVSGGNETRMLVVYE